MRNTVKQVAGAIDKIKHVSAQHQVSMLIQTEMQGSAGAWLQRNNANGPSHFEFEIHKVRGGTGPRAGRSRNLTKTRPGQTVNSGWFEVESVEDDNLEVLSRTLARGFITTTCGHAATSVRRSHKKPGHGFRAYLWSRSCLIFQSVAGVPCLNSYVCIGDLENGNVHRTAAT